MVKNKLLKISFIFLCMVFLSKNGYAKIGYSRLSQLIHNAPYIAKGKISLQNNKVVLKIEKMLKGTNYSEIIISYLHDFEAPDPKFNDGEEVILFLYIPDFTEGYIIPGLGTKPMPEVKEGEMYLFGLGDQAKWPKKYIGKYKFMPYLKLQDTATLEAINNVVQKILKVEYSNNLDEKIKLCTEYIKSSDKLLQYTTMEYALYGGIWASSKKDLQGTVSYRLPKKNKDILKILTDEILKLNLINDDEPTMRSEAVEFLGLTEPNEYVPLLIPKITDEDRLVRSVTCGILIQFARGQKLTGNFINFKPEDSMENLKEVQKQWNNWWEKNIDKFISGDK